MASSPTSSWQIEGEKVEAVTDFIFLGSKITVDGDCSHKIKRHNLWKESYDKPRQCIKKQGHHFADKSPYSQSYDFPSSHLWMWALGHKESWVPKNWCCWIVLLEKTLESPLDCKEIESVSSKEINSEYSLEGLMLKLQYLAPWCKELILWKRTWCWERLKAKGEGGSRGWDS